MNNKEAEELIAEIKGCGKTNYKDTEGNASPWYLNADEVEKIIRHFANKPPYKMDSLYGCAELYRHNLDDEFHLQNITNDGFVLTISFNKLQLIELRDNCTKMLEYLENE